VIVVRSSNVSTWVIRLLEEDGDVGNTTTSMVMDRIGPCSS